MVEGTRELGSMAKRMARESIFGYVCAFHPLFVLEIIALITNYAFKKSDGTIYTGDWEMGLRHGHGVMRYADGTVFEGQWWKDRRIPPGEEGKSWEGRLLLYEKPFDHYFCEPDDLWEKKYVILIHFGSLGIYKC